VTTGVLRARWDGENFVVLAGARHAISELTIGEVYQIEPTLPRSMASHRHYFIVLHRAFENLPEELREQFPNENDLRDHALIMTDHANVQTYVYDSARAARKARDMLIVLLRRHEYCLVDVRGQTLRVRTAKSQSVAAMDRKQFQQSKNDVLGYVASMLGITQDELVRNSSAER
jgi:hypothetical protein